MNQQLSNVGNQAAAIIQNKQEQALRQKLLQNHFGKSHKRSGALKKAITLPTSFGAPESGLISSLVEENPFGVSPPGPELKVGDFIDSWKVIRCEENQFLSLFFGMKGPGLGRLEITIKDDGEEREFDITAWWHPQGFPGLLYWFAMMPAHLFIFKGMVKAIAKEAKHLERE